MAVLVTLLVWLFWLLLVVLAIVLLVPIRMKVRGELSNDGVDFEANGVWGFGLLRARFASQAESGLWLLGFRLRIESWKPMGRTRKGLRSLKQELRGNFRLGRLWKQKQRGFFNVRAFVSVLNLRGALKGSIGFADPADTALLEIILRAAKGWLPRMRLSVRPVYMQECIDLMGFVGSTVWPVMVVWVMIRMFLAKQIRKLPIERFSNP